LLTSSERPAADPITIDSRPFLIRRGRRHASPLPKLVQAVHRVPFAYV
jgi:hypothetical protein